MGLTGPPVSYSESSETLLTFCISETLQQWFIEFIEFVAFIGLTQRTQATQVTRLTYFNPGAFTPQSKLVDLRLRRRVGSPLLFELKIIEASILAVPGDQFLVGPLLHNPAFRKDDDPVGIPDR